MIRIAREPNATPYIQLEVAKEIASYIIPKIKQVQITNAEGDGDGTIRISWDTSPQAIENTQKLENDDHAAEQFKADMKNAAQTVLDGVAEAVLEDDDESTTGLG
jgi:alanyl-tRNA synthetase